MPAYQEILTELYAVLQPFVGEGEELGEDTALVSDLELDSLKMMDLLPQLEDLFDVSIPLNVLPDVITVKDLALQIEAQFRYAG
jgi:acyl carrier protein